MTKKEMRVRKRMQEIEDINQKAKAAGLTYGQYVAQVAEEKWRKERKKRK